MRYRTKLSLAFIGVAIASSTLGLAIVYIESQKLFREELRGRALSIAMTATLAIDSDKVTQISSQADMTNPAYQKLVDHLQELRDLNRHSGLYVKYLYILKPNPLNPHQLIFVADAEENPQDLSKPGDPVTSKDAQGLLSDVYAPFVDSDFTRDRWGSSLSAYAPILDKNDHYVGTIGLDLQASDIRFAEYQLVLLGLSALATSAILSFIASFYFSRMACNPLSSLCSVVKEIGEGNFQCKAYLSQRDEFSDLADAINKMTDGLEERERLKTNFSRYVSEHVLEQIYSSQEIAKLEGERRKITVLFSDIRQFTLLAERLPPEQVVSILNEYFDRMIDTIFAHQGTLDKFIGDGIMVEFGAPLNDAAQEKHALETAIHMIQELRKLNERWAAESKPIFDIGIGIHSGSAIVGNVGSIKRMDYTAVGDTVNVASRLEQATKMLNRPILISETTYAALNEEVPCEDLGLITLPGRSEPIRAYAPIIPDVPISAPLPPSTPPSPSAQNNTKIY